MESKDITILPVYRIGKIVTIILLLYIIIFYSGSNADVVVHTMK